MTEATRELPEEMEHTHKVTVTVYSKGASEMVATKVEWFPDDVDIEELGYFPASYKFVYENFLPVIEQAVLEYEADSQGMLDLLDMESPSTRDN
jgi:hypothetical protein